SQLLQALHQGPSAVNADGPEIVHFQGVWPFHKARWTKPVVLFSRRHRYSDALLIGAVHDMDAHDAPWRVLVVPALDELWAFWVPRRMLVLIHVCLFCSGELLEP